SDSAIATFHPSPTPTWPTIPAVRTSPCTSCPTPPTATTSPPPELSSGTASASGLANRQDLEGLSKKPAAQARRRRQKHSRGVHSALPHAGRCEDVAVGSPQTLSEGDRRIVAAWAAGCAERVLWLFEAEAPQDRRPRDAIAR